MLSISQRHSSKCRPGGVWLEKCSSNRGGDATWGRVKRESAGQQIAHASQKASKPSEQLHAILEVPQLARPIIQMLHSDRLQYLRWWQQRW